MNINVIAFLAAVITCGTTFAEEKAPAAGEAITVSIAIPVHHGQRSLNDVDHFHVVVVTSATGTFAIW